MEAALVHEVRQLRELKQKLNEGVDKVQKNGEAVLQTSRTKHHDIESSVRALERRMTRATHRCEDLQQTRATLAQQRTHVETRMQTLDDNICAMSTRTRECQDSLKAVMKDLRDRQTEYQMLLNRQGQLLKYRDSMTIIVHNKTKMTD